ncbi:MAG TPA: nucleotidyltransferase family protein [Aliidongia sp.]|uniref:nucleotidyltransferase domain-containing protein n=1 Tax=Aliidongia sp. TaxID=1914230 RepID=UPI002DDD05EE|nr:nucleotidyltransferase family protein [Aliidongia sp.]HEV2673680.1 nucleotidyltransferase family protein [Aliidongia sp.]
MRSGYQLLLRILGKPSVMAELTAAQWTGVVAVSRQAGLLARLAELARRDGILETIPAGPAHHLEAARSAAEKHRRDVRWELIHLGRCLADLPGPVVVLKGASYVASGVSARLGRMFGDVDIIVPRAQLDDAERLLMAHGWECSKTSTYDIQYYRRWSHQLPPMHHPIRESVIDLHHALRPPIAPGRVDTTPLFDDARPTEFGLSVPGPTDMIIHSATHLFCASDFRNSLRDLSDIDLLLREFGTSEEWWQNLVQRSRSFGLVSPVAMALLQAKRTLGTPVPSAILASALAAAGRGEHRLLDRLVSQVLPPANVATSLVAAAARGILFARGYFLDMPPSVLAVHLTHKLVSLIPKSRRSERPEPV